MEEITSAMIDDEAESLMLFKSLMGKKLSDEAEAQVNSQLKMLRIFLVKDLTDLSENYSSLSTTIPITEDFLSSKHIDQLNFYIKDLADSFEFLDNLVGERFRKEAHNPFIKDLYKYNYLMGLDIPKRLENGINKEDILFNPNIVILPNVRLEHQEEIKSKHLSIINFDIVDSYENKMLGIFLINDSYRLIPYIYNNYIRKVDIKKLSNKIINALPTDTFELLLTVQNENTNITPNEQYTKRGKKALIIDLEKDNTEDGPYTADVPDPSESVYIKQGC